ncbi:hypothetical protein SRHO_G00130220 [Serrasalmus rhombeus]
MCRSGRGLSSIIGPGVISGEAEEMELCAPCSPPPCGCWGSCFPKIPFFCFETKIRDRQREREYIVLLQKQSRETIRQLDEMKRELKRLSKEKSKLEKRGRQQEMERQKEERERAQRRKWMERVRVCQEQRLELETLEELYSYVELSDLSALETEKESRSEREHVSPARKMDAVQQPWTGPGQKYLPTFYSNTEKQKKPQKNEMDLRIEDIQLIVETGCVQKERNTTSLDEVVRRNAATILQLKEQEEELKRELEELKQRMASIKKSKEVESLPDLGVQQGMERKMIKSEREMIEKKMAEKNEHLSDVERRLEKQTRHSTIRGKLEAMKRKMNTGRKKEAKEEKHSHMEMMSEVEKERQMTEVGKMKRQRWRGGKERRETEEKQRENLDQEPVKQKDKDLLQELVQQREEDLLQEPLQQSEKDMIQEPVKQNEEDLLQEPLKQKEEDLLQEPVKQKEEDVLQEPVKQKEEDLLQEPVKQKEEDVLQEPVKQIKEDQKNDRERVLEIQKARQEYVNRQQQRKKEQLKRMFAPGYNWFISENGAHRRDRGEPDEEPRDLTPSTAESTKDPTPENLEEQINAAPQEPSPQPQAFSEPQKDTHIITGGSKLLNEEDEEV